jgi:hypothetical protein
MNSGAGLIMKLACEFLMRVWAALVNNVLDRAAHIIPINCAVLSAEYRLSTMAGGMGYMSLVTISTKKVKP